jgi:hypothetical protein
MRHGLPVGAGLLVTALFCANAIGSGQTAASKPSSLDERLLLLDAAHLASVRSRLHSDASLETALAGLEQDARRALALKPLSVMDKAVTPPSGDKHDYMSQAPYWWPDPSKPDGRPYIRKDGERNPEINRITDHDNLGRVCSTVSTLGLAFYLTGRAEYAAQAARFVRVWFLDSATRMTPHLKFGQGIPGINDGRGIGIIETRCLPDLLDGIILSSASAEWTSRDEAGLQEWMRAYRAWLTDSTYGQEEGRNGNNHETWYDVQVAALALYTGQREAARTTLEGSKQRIARLFEPDGRQPRELERTRSWDYSEFNLTAFFHLANMGHRVGVDLWGYESADGRSLRRGLDFLAPFAAGDRAWTFDQITPFRPNVLHALLRRAAVGWHAPAYRELATKIGGGNPRLDLILP